MKVLIFTKDLPIKNIGGPCGYLYNVSEYLKKNPSNNISFYHKWNRTFLDKIDSSIEKLLKKVVKFSNVLSFFVTIYFMFYHKKRISKAEIKYVDSFDYVHVHLGFEILQYFKNNKLRHAKIILTTHNPEPYIDEVAGLFNCRELLGKYPKLRDALIKRELQAYEICDKIMFPVRDAREPYELSSKLFEKKFSELDDKFFYVPTALCNVEMIKENEELLKQHNVPDDAFKICYIGRHNKVKGYDFLKKSANHILEKIPGSFFIIGGKEGPLYRLENHRWIELGWVNTAKLLNEVDLFILPNLNTYFDLIFLEILRQGTPIIASKTGGNKWFLNKSTDGIQLFEYDNIEDLTEKVLNIYNIKKAGNLNLVKEANRQFCQSEFNMNLYLKRYIKQIENF